ncbi:MAG TPA: response regulator [Holophagaceae bacterium]|nr:response regulator [Holophagaceae bacterium]
MPEPPAPKVILAVDDDRLTLTVVRRSLEGPERKVLTASNGLEAVEVLRDQAVDLLVTDLDMPLMGGFQLLAHVTSRYPAVPVLVLSGVLDDEKRGKVRELGAMRVLAKPPEPEPLRAAVEALLHRAPDGLFRGMNLLTLLTLVFWEAKTCTLTIHGQNGSSGMLYIQDGQLIHATCSAKEDAEAAAEILGWERADVTMMEACKIGRTFQQPMEAFLLEWKARLQLGLN